MKKLIKNNIGDGVRSNFTSFVGASPGAHRHLVKLGE
jgi:hypothetical protein